MSDLIKLAPSDLTFLWEECPRCFWLKLRADPPNATISFYSHVFPEKPLDY